MKIIRIIAQIAILWLFYLMGDVIVSFLHIDFPASIVGLVLLWLALYFKLLHIKFVLDGASFLISFLTLFFIPSTVGVIQYPELLTVHGLLLVLAVFVSTVFAFIFTGKFSAFMERKEHVKGGANND